MPASPGAMTPAGGSGNTNDVHGKAPKSMGQPDLPTGPGHKAIETKAKPTGSNQKNPY